MKKCLSLSVLVLLLSTKVFGGELVIISDPDSKTSGFLAKDNGKTYLYTSQSAIFGMKLIGVSYSFNAVTSNGKKVLTKGSLEVSPDRDVARIEVQGEYPDAFEIGNVENIGEEITLFPEALINGTDVDQLDDINGLGIYSFTFSTALEENVPGSPILNQEGKVIGVVSGWRSKIIKDPNPVRPVKEEPDKVTPPPPHPQKEK